MDNVKNNAYYADRIHGDLSFIVRHMDGVDQKAFSENEILQDSMMFRLIQVSENARKLSEDYKEQHSAIPWTAISGLRNRLVHDYGNVDLTIVYTTLKNDIPGLLNTIREEIPEQLKDAEPQDEMTEDEKINFVAARILREHIEAFRELAK